MSTRPTYQDLESRIRQLESELDSHRQTEASLRKSQEELAEIFSMSLNMICIADINTATFRKVNPAFTKILGYPEHDLLNHSFLDFIHPDDVQSTITMINQRLKGGHKVVNFTNRYRCANGNYRWLEWVSHPMPERGITFAVAHDISDRKLAQEEKERLQAQFQQAQKLESVGRLAGGVAHDLNNLLSPILGYAEMLMEEFSGDDSHRDYAEQIVQAAIRARNIVRQLLAFSRKQTMQIRSISLSDVITRFRALLRQTIREDIVIDIVADPSVPCIRADAGQLEQVIMNLAVNAQDAMPCGGTLTIAVGLTHIDEVEVAVQEDLKPGMYVTLTVSDTGEGIDAETRRHIFEPFFTTKEMGKGTGLGLATVYGIVMQHGGDIRVQSEPGKGSVFRIRLPVSNLSDAPEKNDGQPAKLMQGRETILLVEDNEQVRNLTLAILKRKGYSIRVAANGMEALDTFRANDGAVHLLVTDVIMPRMNGKELFEQLSARFPDLKVLYMSGYSQNILALRGAMDVGVNFIQKPFSLNALAVKVREVLDQ